jgi:threonine/homoserine/homoserine lactone efflux protein
MLVEQILALAAGCLAAGAAVSLPFGPMGLLAARLIIEGHRRKAIGMGLGCVTADFILAFSVLIGVGWLPKLGLENLWHVYPLWAAAGGGLIAYGGILLTQPLASLPMGALPAGFKSPYRCALTYTFIHPASLLTFIAAFGLMHIHGDLPESIILRGLGVILVGLSAVAMWAAWLGLVYRVRKKLDPDLLRTVFARAFALTLMGAGIYLLSHALQL